MKRAWLFMLFMFAGLSPGCDGNEAGEDAGADAEADETVDRIADRVMDPDVSVEIEDIPGDDGTSGESPVCDRTEHEGVATYYTFADGSGNCSFPPTPDDLNVAAMNDVEYEGSFCCGGCVTLEGPLGSVTVRIVDRCPECEAGHLDLSPVAFDRIARREEGIVPISWHYVPCEVAGPIRYHFKEGSNQWWSAVQVRNHRHRIAKFEFLDETGAFQEVPRVSYNFFVWESGMGPGPYTFRVTDEYGQVLADSDIPFIEAGEVEGTGQFPACEW
jgi:expansin (peptidoglycan-binding protein)